MSHEQIAILSFCIITASIIPYAWRISTGRAHTSITGWAVSTVTGFVTFLTYKGIGATGNIWIAAVELIDPLLIVVAAVIGRNIWDHIDRHEKAILVVAIVALILHVLADSRGAAQFAYACAMLADVLGAWAVVRFSWKQPRKEQPLAWSLSIVGVILSFFSIENLTLDQVSLPLYQLLFCILILIPTLRYHIKQKIPLRHWM